MNVRTHPCICIRMHVHALLVHIYSYMFAGIGADVNGNISIGVTPLGLAVHGGLTEIIKCLLKAGADANILNKDGLKPIEIAAVFGKQEVVEILFPSTSPISSVPDWSIDGIITDLKSKVPKQLPKKVSHNGFTPLMMSVLAGSLQCMEELIEVNSMKRLYETCGGLTEIIKCLLKAGADANIPNKDGLKPIEIAAVFGKQQDVKILFPSTSPISSVPDWSIDGIITDLKSKVPKQLLHIHSQVVQNPALEY
ncbi:ankyrin repeat and SOCS box protein 2-like [Phoenix dactylifera]|uniref:Ankyrin repeat and SOCS box protein 2-like n=1 Tax=Phoenix dactylifera TaxID=42345 RepID=A0A8B8ZQ64_PHODC|nr:ankyrin repeat and SOCS box protein 2-like [Phoenix dactylifera]